MIGCLVDERVTRLGESSKGTMIERMTIDTILTLQSMFTVTIDTMGTIEGSNHLMPMSSTMRGRQWGSSHRFGIIEVKVCIKLLANF